MWPQEAADAEIARVMAEADRECDLRKITMKVDAGRAVCDSAEDILSASRNLARSCTMGADTLHGQQIARRGEVLIARERQRQEQAHRAEVARIAMERQLEN